MARLFIAVWPPEEVVEELMSLPRKDQRGVRFVEPQNWHITLRFLGEARPDAVVDALTGAEFGPAVARLGPGVDALGERALVVPVSGVDDLAATVERCTSRLGEPARKRFVGHLTIARLKPYRHLPRAMGALIQSEFEVDEVALVDSRLDPSGARYETIHSWPVE